jgi:hypothetical protein
VVLGREIQRLRERNKGGAQVVYLRSFVGEGLRLSDIKSAFDGERIPGTEGHWRNGGHLVTSFLDVIGPPVELASPTGASGLSPWSPSRPRQERVANEKWQQRVLELLSQAALVAVQLDASPGLAWEVSQLVRRVPPKKVLLILPSRKVEYAELRSATVNWFPRPLPDDLPKSRLVTFRPNWEPLVLEAGKGAWEMWQALEPVFLQNGYEAPDWRRAFRIGEHRASSKGSAKG